LELLHQLAPDIAAIGVLVNPTNPTLAESLWKDAQEAAGALGLQVRLLHASSDQDFARVFGSSASLGTGALLIGADGFFTSRIELLAQLAIKHRLPSICSYREFSTAGGLISYGTSVVDAYRQVGVYTGKVLKGENPADLPIIRPTKFEFVINLKTARMAWLDGAAHLAGCCG
jgi:putative ABC transport system substrate-binding protein